MSLDLEIPTACKPASLSLSAISIRYREPGSCSVPAVVAGSGRRSEVERRMLRVWLD